MVIGWLGFDCPLPAGSCVGAASSGCCVGSEAGSADGSGVGSTPFSIACSTCALNSSSEGVKCDMSNEKDQSVTVFQPRKMTTAAIANAMIHFIAFFFIVCLSFSRFRSGTLLPYGSLRLYVFVRSMVSLAMCVFRPEEGNIGMAISSMYHNHAMIMIPYCKYYAINTAKTQGFLKNLSKLIGLNVSVFTK